MHHPSLALLLALVVADASASVPMAMAQRAYSAVEDTIVRPSIQFDVTRFDSITAISLRNILDSATTSGLPARPLINIALEGAARRAPAARILSAVRAHWAAMEDARRVLGPRAGSAELDASAHAMRQGVDGGTLSLLRRARSGTTIIKPLVVLTDIIGRGVPFATANDAVVTIARMPGSDDALDTMQSLVAKAATRGGPGMAVEALQRYLRENAGRFPSGTSSRQPDR